LFASKPANMALTSELFLINFWSNMPERFGEICVDELFHSHSPDISNRLDVGKSGSDLRGFPMGIPWSASRSGAEIMAEHARRRIYDVVVECKNLTFLVPLTSADPMFYDYASTISRNYGLILRKETDYHGSRFDLGCTRKTEEQDKGKEFEMSLSGEGGMFLGSHGRQYIAGFAIYIRWDGPTWYRIIGTTALAQSTHD
jgi:hypothetical protein